MNKEFSNFEKGLVTRFLKNVPILESVLRNVYHGLRG